MKLPYIHRLPPEAQAEFYLGVRTVAPQFIGAVPFGIAAGVACTAAGLTVFETVALSFICFSGVAQLVVAQLTAIGAPALVVLSAVLIISLRLTMYSASTAPLFAHLPRRMRYFIAFNLTDHAFAMQATHAAAPGDKTHRHWFYVGAAIPMYTVWQLAVIIGAIAGSRVPAAWQLDFAVTLSFITMIKPALRRRADWIAGVVASAVVLIAAGLPYRLALVVASLAGIAAGMLADPAPRHGKRKEKTA